jgi:5-methylcytosine-specific restriction enzyme A
MAGNEALVGRPIAPVAVLSAEVGRRARREKNAGRARLRLTVEPLCRMCQAAGQIEAATVADHVVLHRGDPDLFWHGELQSLCATCHSRFKQSEESGGTKHLMGCDQTGEPLFCGC